MDDTTTVTVIPFSLENLNNGNAAIIAVVAITFFLINQLLARATKASNSSDKDAQSSQKDSSVEDQYPGGEINVYFGSQTGTAESFARELEREGPEHGFKVNVVSLEGISPEDLVDESHTSDKSKTARALFLVSTYGEGEPSDNAADFVAAMKEKMSEGSSSCLSGLDYAVFGLGNKQYDHFNAMGKFFDKSLGEVGGNRIVEVVLGDDDCDLEGDFENWKDNMVWSTLEQLYLSESTKSQGSRGSISIPSAQYELEYLDAGSSEVAARSQTLPLEQVRGPSRPYFTAVECPVKEVRELRTSEDTGSTVHVEIDISKAGELTYETADNLGVLPVNDTANVESVANSLGYNLDAIFTLKAPLDQDWQGAPFPNPISVRECLTLYTDLNAAPRRADLKVIAAYAQDSSEQAALLRLASKDGKDEYRDAIINEYVNMATFLERFSSIKMPLEHFLSVCPLLQTRFYTISSSSSVHPGTIHLTVTVDQAKRTDGSLFTGVCSGTISGCKPGASTLRVYSRPSTFRLPKDSSKPIIMIGPGTGIAPMRALLQERSHQRTVLGQGTGKNVLYFGCKNASQDFLYQNELAAYQESGDLDELFVAFSRQQKDAKVYVQHLLAGNAPDTYKLLEEEGAYVYVCGAVRMGNDVADVLRDILAKEGGMTQDEAKSYLARMAKEGRYVQELWA